MDKLKKSLASSFKTNDVIELIEKHDDEYYIKKAGGWGRMQLFCCIFTIMAYQGPNFYAYNMACLELVPRLLCGVKGETLHECGAGIHTDLNSYEFAYDTAYKSEICDRDKIRPDVYFEVDYSDPKSFHNWMTDQQLYCHSGFNIGLLGSMFFLGFAFSGILLKMSDYIGRLAIVQIGQIVQILCCYSFYFSNNIYSYYTTMFVLGITWGKSMITYLLLSETCPKSTHIYISAIVVASDNFIPLIVVPLYFYLGGEHWKNIFSLTLILPVITLVMTYFIPESPRYLYSKRRYAQLDITMKYIARVNGIELNINSEEDKQIFCNCGTIDSLHFSQSKSKASGKEYSILDDLKTPAVVLNLLIMIIGFSVVSFNNYILMIYTKYIGGNIFINNISIGFSTFASGLSAVLLKQVFEDKYNLAANIFISVIFLLPLLFSPPTCIVAVCCFVSSLGIFSGYPLLFVLVTDLFHPLFVPFVFSACNLVGRAFTMVSSQIAEMPNPIPVISAILIQVIMILSITFLKKT